MTVQERLAAMIDVGATIQVFFPDAPSVTLLLAGVLWRRNPTRLRWCAVFPDDQHHVHETKYDEAKQLNGGRDVAFYHSGSMVAYACPYEESGGQLDEMRDALGEWRALLKQDGGARFTTFLQEA